MAHSYLAAIAEACGLGEVNAMPATPAADRAAMQPASCAQPAATPPAPQPPAATKLSIAETVIAEWNNDAAIRAELRTFGAYSAWRTRELCKAEGISFEQYCNATPDVTGYIARCEARGQRLGSAEKDAISRHAETWRTMPAIRREFGRFDVFAAYMRHKGPVS